MKSESKLKKPSREIPPSNSKRMKNRNRRKNEKSNSSSTLTPNQAIHPMKMTLQIYPLRIQSLNRLYQRMSLRVTLLTYW